MRVRHLKAAGGAAIGTALTLVLLTAAPATGQQAAPATGQQAPATDQQQGTLRQPDVIYVPTPQEVVDAMLAMANVTAKDVVYDLGSGDGRIPITAAQKYGARAIGIDIDPQRIKEANENLAKAGVSNKVKFLNQDLFATDISDATVVTLYLLPSLNLKLIPKLKALKPGTRIVSHSFDMGSEWPPEKTQDVNGRMIYYWTIK
jgi:16S rRNA G966 N2-methylase RsmD